MKSILILIFIIALIINVISLIHIFKKSRQHGLSISKVMGFYLYVLSQFMMSLIFVNVAYDADREIITALCILALIIIMLPIKSLKKILDDIIEKEEVDERYNALLRKMETNEKHYLMLKDYEDELSKLRHDFMNQVNVAYSVIKNSPNKEAGIELLDSLSEKIQSTRVNALCNNRMINIVISMKQKELTELGLSLDTEIIIPGKQEEIENDLSFVLINLLEEVMEIHNMNNNGKMDVKKVSLNIKKKDEKIVVVLKYPQINIKEDSEYRRILEYYKEYFLKIIDKHNGELYYREGNNLDIILTMQGV